MPRVDSTSMEKKQDHQFSCPTCGKHFTIKSNLLRHIRMTHRVDTEEYQCNTCNYSTKRGDLFLRHKQKCVLKKQHQCSNCATSNSKRKRESVEQDAIYVKKQKRRIHNHVESRKPVSMYNCRLCEFRCANRALLYRHHHQVFIIFICML